MNIRPGTTLYIFMRFWPIILSGFAVLFFFPSLTIGKLILLFAIGVLSSYGINMFVMVPVTSILTPIMPIISNKLNGEKLTKFAFIFHHLGSIIITLIILITIGNVLSE